MLLLYLAKSALAFHLAKSALAFQLAESGLACCASMSCFCSFNLQPPLPPSYPSLTIYPSFLCLLFSPLPLSSLSLFLSLLLPSSLANLSPPPPPPPHLSLLLPSFLLIFVPLTYLASLPPPTSLSLPPHQSRLPLPFSLPPVFTQASNTTVMV